MKNFKKSKALKAWSFLSCILAFVLIFSACGKKEAPSNKTEEPVSKTEESVSAKEEPLRILTLKGPTAMGMAPMMAEDNPERTFEIAGAPDVAVAKLLKGQVDLCAIPANLASVIYQKSDKGIKVLNINTLGVLYMVERGDKINSIKDLEGKTLVTSGKGATPEYVLKYLLKANGLDETKVNIDWRAEHSEVVSAMIKNEKAIGLLPEPFVSVAKGKIKDLRSALDLTKAWDDLQKNNPEPSSLVMGVLVARKEALKDKERIGKFLKDYEKSIEEVKADPEKAAKIIGEKDIVPEKVAKQAIPNCNMVFVKGEKMQAYLSGFLKVLFDQNPKSVGGQLPDGDFYWKAED